MKKVLALLALVIVVFAAGAAFAAEPIKIGYLAALTGDYAQYGITEVNMAKLVVGDINAKGGILGRQIDVYKRQDVFSASSNKRSWSP